jgi:outer membrane protein TolC
MNAVRPSARLFLSLLSLLLALPLVPAPASAQSHVLTLADAVRLALRKSPVLQAASSGVDAARGREGQAMSGWLPTVAGVASYNRQTGNYTPRPGATPTTTTSGSLTSSNTSYNVFNFGLSLQQTVWDFGRTLGQHRRARAGVDAARSDLADVRLALASLVVQQYYAVLATEDLVGVALRTAEQAERSAAQAKAMFEAGTRPRIDVARTEADSQGAKAGVLAAHDARAVALESLLASIGDPTINDVAVTVPAEDAARVVVPVDLEGAVREALSRRPDRAALDARIQAQEAAVGAVTGNYWPILSANASITDGGVELNNMAWNWGVGALVTVPILSAVNSSYQVQEAKAVLAQLKSQRDALDMGTRAEVRQTVARLSDALARLTPLGAQVVAATEARDLARGRYEAGAGNSVELLDAQSALSNAEAGLVRARFDLAVARVGFEVALGRMPLGIGAEGAR